MAPPKQITLRNLSPELAGRLKAFASSRGESLNTTIVRLLEQAVGVGERETWLRDWTAWDASDHGEIADALAQQRVVDERLWG